MLSKSLEAVRPQANITSATAIPDVETFVGRHVMRGRDIAAEPSDVSDAIPIVFVVDGDTTVRESLELLVGDAGWQPETFESAQAFMSRPRVLVPSCLILDVSHPGSNGLDLQKRFAAERPDMPIIFITRHGDVSMAVQAMKGGAVEFLTKPFRDAALMSAIQHAIERSAFALRLDTEMQELRARYASLSRREQEVMGLVVRGLLNKQVGFDLGISEITVKAHRGKVMRKMNAGSFADLVNIAARLRLGGGSSKKAEPRRMNPWLRDEETPAVMGGHAS
jgi:FixJ family two-component response regulator